VSRRSLGVALVVGLAMVVAAGLLAYWSRGQWFGPDDLGYATRLGSEPLGHALLHPPSNKYLIAVPLLVYDGMFRAFGIDTYVPERIAGILLVLTCAGLLFMLLRRRLGDVYAIPPMLLVLFFGAGAEVVVTPVRIPSQIALAAGLGMMLALERWDRRGDALAMVLLGVSLASHPIGISFAAAGAVMILLRSRDGWRSLWVVAVPGALFATWWLFLRPPTTPTFVPNRASDVFPFVRESWAALTAAVSGLFGVLDQPSFHQPVAWIAAGALLALVVAGAAWSWRRLPPLFWAAVLGLVVMMATTRLSPGGFLRMPDEPRYLYPEAFLLLIALGALAAALKLPSWAMLVGSAVLLVSLWPNIDRLHDASVDARQTSGDYRAKWSAVEIAGSHGRPGYMPDVFSVSASGYLHAVRAFGNGGFSDSGLAARPNGDRIEADRTLVGALALQLTPAGGPPPTEGPPPHLESPPGGETATAPGCLTVAAIGGGQPLSATSPSAKVVLPTGGAWIGPGPLAGAQLSIGQFADRPSVPITVPAGPGAAALHIPPDEAGAPWRIQIQSRRATTLCGFAPKAGP
jgi:hypothetical protein